MLVGRSSIGYNFRRMTVWKEALVVGPESKPAREGEAETGRSRRLFKAAQQSGLFGTQSA
jgi:hypothetical protein